MANKAEIAKIYKYISTAYPNHLLPKVEIYVEILSDIPGEQVEAAAREFVRKGKEFPPNPGQLAQLAFDLQDVADGRLSAPEAWEMTIREIRNIGYVGRPNLPELVMKAIRSVGGWMYLCHSEHLVSDRARFIEAYEIYDKRDRDSLRMLPGVKEFINTLASSKSVDQLTDGKA